MENNPNNFLPPTLPKREMIKIIENGVEMVFANQELYENFLQSRNRSVKDIIITAERLKEQKVKEPETNI